ADPIVGIWRNWFPARLLERGSAPGSDIAAGACDADGGPCRPGCRQVRELVRRGSARGVERAPAEAISRLCRAMPTWGPMPTRLSAGEGVGPAWDRSDRV